MLTDFLSIASCLALAENRSGAKPVDTSVLVTLLEVSRGIDPQGQIVYRPYWVAAKFLEQSRSVQALSEADGVKFTRMQTPIESLLSLQESLDQSLGLTIPKGFEITPIGGSNSTPRISYSIPFEVVF